MFSNQEINRITEEFTKALESGQSPRIAAFVDQVDPLHRQQVLQALIPLDVKFLRLKNQLITAEDYAEFGAEAVEIARREIARGEISSQPSDFDFDETGMFVSKQSLSDDSFSVNESVLRSLGRTVDVPPKISLRDSGDIAPDQAAQPSSNELPEHKSMGRYQLHGEIARGGMGAILKGHDTDLGRDLAIKVLLDKQKDRPEVVQRFIEEAQIGGQLQHPGIAPVYELGQFADKRPFFTMKLVKGETLSVLLKGRDDMVKDRAKFLGIFEQICQTMAYAHSRGVIHRDLKPANIMVGAFGEVQVMDWGLAKVLTEDAKSEEKQADGEQNHDTIIQTLRRGTHDAPIGMSGSGSGGSDTQMGSVLGTPAYMPPEQALGEIDRLDERADVFGLGAILCEILTGKPPYIGEDLTQVFRLASRGKLDACFDRLESSDAGDEMIAITKLCLGLEPQDRPDDAGVLSDRISSYLTSVETRLREAELEGASQAVRLIEERKRRRVTVVLGVVGAAFIALAGIGAFMMQQNRAAIADANLKNEIATLQRNQELAAQAEKARQVVNNELAIGQSLLAEASGREEPNRDALRRLMETANRANVSLSAELQETELGQQVRALLSGSKELNLTAELVKDLEEIRIANLEQSMQQTWQSVYSTDRPVREIDAKILSTGKIRDAWAKWGVTPATSAVEVGNMIQQVSPWAKSSLIDSLHVWNLSLKNFDRFANAACSDWHPLILTEAKSSGGSVLTRQPDDSILASGVNPRGDVYELTFNTDLRSFNALQIEALNHPSLPLNGPGRGVRGEAIANEIEVFCRSAEGQNVICKGEIAAADTDYSNYSRVRAASWNLSRGENKSRRLFQYFAEPMKAPENCEIVVRFSGNSGPNWGDRNLGCFRISVASIVDSGNDITGDWIENVLLNSQVPTWTAELWSAITKQDVPKMVQLAQSPDAELASDIDVVRLAGEIWQYGEAEYLSQLRSNYDWYDVEKKQIESRSSLVQEEDGAFFVQGEQFPTTDVFRIRIEDVYSHPTAFWLETIKDQRLPDNGPGTHKGLNGCVISEVSFWDAEPDLTADDPTTERLVRRPIVQVVSETKRVSRYSPENAIDKQTATLWRLQHPQNAQSCTTIFRIGALNRDKLKTLESAEDEIQSEMDVVIHSGAVSAANRLLGKFRLKYTTEDLSSIVDPRLEAMSLLRAVYANQPDNYRLLVAMSLMSSRDTLENRTLATSFAASAVVLRPSNDSSLQVFANATLARRPAPDDPWLNMLVEIAKSNPSETSRRVLKAAHDQQIERGRNSEYDEPAKATQAFLKAIEIGSEEVVANLRSQQVVINLYLRSGDLAKAEQHLVDALSLDSSDPTTWDLMAKVRLRQNRFPEAAEYFGVSLALQRVRESGVVFRTSELLRLQQFPEVLEAVEFSIQRSGSLNDKFRYPRALAYAETGKLEASVEEWARCIKLFPESSYHLEMLCTMQLAGANSDDAEFDRVLTLFSNLESVNRILRASLFEPRRTRAPMIQQIGFHQVIASALAEKNDTDPDFWATAALADLSAEDWSQANESVNRMIELSDEPNLIDLTLMAACDWKLGQLSQLKTDIEKAAKEGSRKIRSKERRLLGLARLKLGGMLAADPDDQAFEQAIEFLLMPETRSSSQWNWNRIFFAWLLRADEAQVSQAFEVLFPAGIDSKSHSKNLALIKAWIDARLGRTAPALAKLEKRLVHPNRSFMDMMFLAKALSDAGRSEDAARAIFESKLLLDLEWHPDQPNKHLQPEIKWAYAIAQKQLEAFETVLPKYQPERPELEYLVAAKAWLKTKREQGTAKLEPKSPKQ